MLKRGSYYQSTTGKLQNKFSKKLPLILSRSILKNWIEQEADKDSVINLQESIGTSPLLAKLLVQRGLSDHSVAKKFLRPKLLYLEDPFSILNMDKAISRILLAREKKQKVLIVGDYDVDGITSTVMIKQALKSIDIHAETIIPKGLVKDMVLLERFWKED